MRRASARGGKKASRTTKQRKAPHRRRPTREEMRQRRKKFRAAHQAIKRQALREGRRRATQAAPPNRVVPYASQAEEAADRERITVAFVNSIKSQLPAILQGLSKIADPRSPKKVEHQLALVLFYGMLCFVLQMESRRAANRELTGPVLIEHLRQYFPDLDKLPHHDSVNRVLAQIDVERIQDLHLQMIRRLVRNKKFDRFLVEGCYPIAIDGTQKLTNRALLSPEWQERVLNQGTEAEQTQYYVYVLEASLSFANGMTLPLLSEFLNYEEGDTEHNKQDCEMKAFKRLTKRLKDQFPRLRIMLLLDGLYPNGPVFAICRRFGWQSMIVFKDGSLPTVWEEFDGLIKLERKNRAELVWGNRRQVFRWVNDIEYRYDGNRKHQMVHVVECRESWDVVDATSGECTTQTSRHVWISSEPLHRNNLHERCNLAARHRWNIEEGILTEKRQGYQYEHCFSQDWQAMKGYHYLMHLGHALNVLAQYAEALYAVARRMGIRAFIKFIRDSLVHPWLDAAKLKALIAPASQLRLV